MTSFIITTSSKNPIIHLPPFMANVFSMNVLQKISIDNKGIIKIDFLPFNQLSSNGNVKVHLFVKDMATLTLCITLPGYGSDTLYIGSFGMVCVRKCRFLLY